MSRDVWNRHGFVMCVRSRVCWVVVFVEWHTSSVRQIPVVVVVRQIPVVVAERQIPVVVAKRQIPVVVAKRQIPVVVENRGHSGKDSFPSRERSVRAS